VCEATVRTTAMVVAILVGAFFLNIVIQAIGLTQQLSRLITTYQLTPVQVLSAVIVLYLVLGTFMEELSMMIDRYYGLRGWDDDGVPTRARPAALGI